MRNVPYLRIWHVVSWLVALLSGLAGGGAGAESFRLEVEQITHGPDHHFFGYIGQCQTCPWNASGRTILALRTKFHDRMPTAEDAADVCLVDAESGRVEAVDATRAWNFQQGTMFYWHPRHPETQFFFNDRDPETGLVYTVLYDAAARRRIQEYRFDDPPVANGGVAPTGEYFLAINYARMARLRPVTGYPGTTDPTRAEPASARDGVFRVDIATGERRLLASLESLRSLAEEHDQAIDGAAYYINHTLPSRDEKYVYFFTRGRVGGEPMAVNFPCTVRADGTELKRQLFVGGHPEWDEGTVVIGALEDQQVRYDVERQDVVGQLGSAEIFPSPGGDIALGPNAEWFANGRRTDQRTNLRYVVLRRSDGMHAESPPLSCGPYHTGVLRIDPAPRWNRTATEILVPGIVADGTRQLHRIRIVADNDEGPANGR